LFAEITGGTTADVVSIAAAKSSSACFVFALSIFSLMGLR